MSYLPSRAAGGSLATHASTHVAGGSDEVAINLLTGAVTDTQVPVGAVTQHQAALSIDAAQLTGTIVSARLSGVYSGITGVGELTTGSINEGFGEIDITEGASGNDFRGRDLYCWGITANRNITTDTGNITTASGNISAIDGSVIGTTSVEVGATGQATFGFHFRKRLTSGDATGGKISIIKTGSRTDVMRFDFAETHFLTNPVFLSDLTLTGSLDVATSLKVGGSTNDATDSVQFHDDYRTVRRLSDINVGWSIGNTESQSSSALWPTFRFNWARITSEQADISDVVLYMPVAFTLVSGVPTDVGWFKWTVHDNPALGLVNLEVKANAASFTGSLGATTLGGTLTTAAQPNVTSLGTLTSLAVSGTANFRRDTATTTNPTTTWQNLDETAATLHTILHRYQFNTTASATVTAAEWIYSKEQDWTSTGTTQDTKGSLWLAQDGSLVETLRVLGSDKSVKMFGSLGIGITPTFPLHVSGQARFNSEVAIGRAPIVNQQLLIRDTGVSGSLVFNFIDPGQTDNLLVVFGTVGHASKNGVVLIQNGLAIGTNASMFGVLDNLVHLKQTETITGAVTDGYTAALRLDPGYTAASALTVTRHNYIEVQDVSLAGAGPAALTDAAVFRFDAAAGTHKALTTEAVKINVNGTLQYMPFYPAGGPLVVPALTVGGDITPNGELTRYAGISASGAADTIVIGAAGIANKVQIDTFDTNSPSSGVTPDHANDHMTVLFAGNYKVTCCIHADSTGGAAGEYGFSVWVNDGGVEKANLHAHQDWPAGGGVAASVAICGIATFAANDTVELWVWNEDAGNSIIINDISLSMMYLGS